MKKVLCLLAVLGFAGILAQAAPQKRIEVSSVEQFLAAIDNDRIIVLTEETYMLTEALRSGDYDALRDAADQKVYFVEEFDGPELHIAHVENLTIEAGTDVVTIMSDPRYANVISFEDCTDLTLTGITFGHTEEGYCSQGVLGFYGCTNVLADRLDLFGCGTEGIIVQDSREFCFKACKIRDCSYHIMHLNGCNHIVFDGCQFFRNREYELVNISGCENVTFFNCIFANNTGRLFNVSSTTVLHDCVILHDPEQYGEDYSSENVFFINCITEDYFHSEQALG